MENIEKYVSHFIITCETVFRDFVGTSLIAERSYISNKNDDHEWEVSAIMAFTGEARGMIAISMKKEPALKIAETLTGTVHTEMDNEVADAVGEIVNIIAGNAKKGLEETFRLVISLPLIAMGENHKIIWPKESSRIISVIFKIFEINSLCLSITIKATGEKGD